MKAKIAVIFLAAILTSCGTVGPVINLRTSTSQPAVVPEKRPNVISEAQAVPHPVTNADPTLGLVKNHTSGNLKVSINGKQVFGYWGEWLVSGEESEVFAPFRKNTVCAEFREPTTYHGSIKRTKCKTFQVDPMNYARDFGWRVYFYNGDFQ